VCSLRPRGVKAAVTQRQEHEGFTDRRYAGADTSIEPVGDRVDTLAAAGDDAHGSLDPEDADLGSAAAALGDGLSAEARATLELMDPGRG
jgi:hypothetical protein